MKVGKLFYKLSLKLNLFGGVGKLLLKESHNLSKSIFVVLFLGTNYTNLLYRIFSILISFLVECKEI